MKTKTYFPAICLNILFLFACNKEKNSFPVAVDFPDISCSNKIHQIDTVKMMLPGTYNWCRTTTSSRGGYFYSETPKTKGTRKYVFFTDGKLWELEGEILQRIRYYEVGYLSLISPLETNSSAYIFIRNAPGDKIADYYSVALCNDSAILSRPASVSFTIYFTRN